MGERTTFTPGTFSWADLSTTDTEGAKAFYSGLFGWEPDDMPVGDGSVYTMMRRGDKSVAAISAQQQQQRDAGVPPMWNNYVTVESADAAAEKATGLGATVHAPPFDVLDAGRMAVFADLEGAAFSVWQPNRHRGATVVNEPGSLNFNGLNTRDPEGAKAFYGAVFGWEALPMGMWALTAYGDHLETLNPGTRERMAEMGGPERFEEVVAALNVIPDDQPDTPAHWDVTFGVADADAIAERAAELGGTVLVPPFDAPWIRGTVIRDPQGATFNANQFVPENQDLTEGADAAISGP
jgi:predicted enzyme related to lactoylglutathione lyase